MDRHESMWIVVKLSGSLQKCVCRFLRNWVDRYKSVWIVAKLSRSLQKCGLLQNWVDRYQSLWSAAKLCGSLWKCVDFCKRYWKEWRDSCLFPLLQLIRKLAVLTRRSSAEPSSQTLARSRRDGEAMNAEVQRLESFRLLLKALSVIWEYYKRLFLPVCATKVRIK